MHLIMIMIILVQWKVATGANFDIGEMNTSNGSILNSRPVSEGCGW